MTKNFSKLVDAVNYLNEYAPQIIAQVKAKLDPFIGSPIFKVDDSFRKSVNWQNDSIKKQLPNGDWLNVTYSVRRLYDRAKYVDLHIKICLNGGSYDVHPTTAFTIYQETSLTIYLLDYDGNIVLPDFEIDLTQYSKRYDAETLQALANIATEKAKELQTAIDMVPYRFREALNVPSLR